MTKEILNFKNQSIFDRLFIINYFVAILFLIFDCIVAAYLPHQNNWYGFWNMNQTVSVLGIITLLLNSLFTGYFISLIIARFIKKPWIANIEEKINYQKRLSTYIKFNLPVVICLWVVITLGLINKPGLIQFPYNDIQTLSLLFVNTNKYFDIGALIVFVVISMLWLGILTQIIKDAYEFIKVRKQQQKYAS